MKLFSVFGTVVKKSFGILAMLIGLAISAWCAYNLFVPQKEFLSSTGNPTLGAIKGIFLGLIFAGFGAAWLFGVRLPSGKDQPEKFEN